MLYMPLLDTEERKPAKTPCAHEIVPGFQHSANVQDSHARLDRKGVLPGAVDPGVAFEALALSRTVVAEGSARTSLCLGGTGPIVVQLQVSGSRFVRFRHNETVHFAIGVRDGVNSTSLPLSGSCHNTNAVTYLDFTFVHDKGGSGGGFDSTPRLVSRTGDDGVQSARRNLSGARWK